MLSMLWVGFFAVSFICAMLSGTMPEVCMAVTDGANAAIELVLKIIGVMCFWSGIMEIVSKSGLSAKIEKVLRPILRVIFTKADIDTKTMQLISANVTANLLGMSNAATPIGLEAVSRLYNSAGKKGTPDSVLTLIVLNTASIQIIPTTVAAIRASFGAQNPFDILPAVWGASAISVIVVLVTAKMLRDIFPDR